MSSREYGARRRPTRLVVAVTGAAGGIGPAVAARLAASPTVRKTVALDREPVDLPEVVYRRADIRDPALTEQFTSMAQSITDFRRVMLNSTSTQQADYARKLAQLQQALLNDLHDTFQLIQQQDNTTPPSVADLPPRSSMADRPVSPAAARAIRVATGARSASSTRSAKLRARSGGVMPKNFASAALASSIRPMRAA